MLSDGADESSFTTDDCSAIATASARLSKRASTSGLEFVNLVKDLVDELESSRAATAKAKKEILRQKRLVSEAVKVVKRQKRLVSENEK